MRKLLLLSILLLSLTIAKAQDFETPVIGAQVFIEPGQTAEDIDEFFAILERNHMKVARIRMFGAHIFRNGEEDFSLYDMAFDAAHRHGVKIFATLFPTTDELRDVGGFKFPNSKAHLVEIDDYIRKVVRHFRNHPALSTWVLQNEPGQKVYRMVDTDLYREVLKEWKQAQPLDNFDNGYLKADFVGERMVTYYTLWYLKHISDIVIEEDPKHGRHVNPFQIMGYLSAHYYKGYEEFLTSLGLSMHMSSHFTLFNQDEYTVASCMMNDIIRSGAGKNPYWVTELQGGNVMASGKVPYCPPGNHVSQYIWTSLARGAKGVMFWTLNQRGAVQEAGEWGVLDYQRKETDRMLAAGKIAEIMEIHGPRISNMKPISAPITLLYSHESFYVQRMNARTYVSDIDARKIDAIEKSLAVAYQALSANGICPEVSDFYCFDWSNPKGRVIVLPDCIAVSHEYWEKIRNFVHDGGKLIVTGRSFYYDDNMFCTHMYKPFPLSDCFGAQLSEYKADEDYFSLPCGLTGHLWRGILSLNGATPIIQKGDEILGVRNYYGAGEVVWVPTPIELGAYHREMKPLEQFYASECAEAINKTPIRFQKLYSGVVMASMTDEDVALVVISNKSDKRQKIKLNIPFEDFVLLDGSGKVGNSNVTLNPDEFVAVLLKKN